MKCLPLEFHKFKTDLSGYVTYSFKAHRSVYNSLVHNSIVYNSFNDQPSLVEVDHCAQDEKKYLFWHKENFKRRSLGKPHTIYLENGIIMDMAFNNSEPEKMKKVHPDYRDDWIRLYAQESGK